MSTPKKPTATKKTSKKTAVKPHVSIDVLFDNTFPKVEFDDNVSADLRKKIETILLAPSVRKMIKNGEYAEASEAITDSIKQPNVDIIVEKMEGEDNKIWIIRIFVAATVIATRWEYELGHLVRKVRTFTAYSSDDLANEPEKSKQVEENLKKDISKKGWFLSDTEASLKADQAIECDLDQLSHDLMYNKACKHCIAKKVREAAENLGILRDWCIDHMQMSTEIEKAGNKVPAIIPDLEKFHLEDGKFVRNEPEIEFEKLNASPEKKKALTDLLTSIIEDNKEKK